MCHRHTVVFYLAMKRKKVCREMRLTESTVLNEVMQEWKVKNQLSSFVHRQKLSESIYISVSKWD